MVTTRAFSSHDALLLRRLSEILLTAAVVVLVLLLLTGITQPGQLRVPVILHHRVISDRPTTTAKAADGPSWPSNGWAGIRTIYAFGDSYSATDFDPDRAQPSSKNPFGNPDVVLKLVSDSVWLRFLSILHDPPDHIDPFPLNSDDADSDHLKIYNLAISGSVIDPKVIPARQDSRTATLTSQIHDVFLPHYSKSQSWSAGTTLFTLWLGINDITLSSRSLAYPPLTALLTAYTTHWETLYSYGARNFLILNVPPIYKAHTDAEHASFEAATVLNFNLQLQEAVSRFRTRHKDTRVFLFDTHALWEEVLEAPEVFEATRQLVRLEDPCEAYSERRGTLPPDYMDESCDVAVEQYFWRDGLHATYPVHNLTAEMVVRDCFAAGGPVSLPRGYCS